jgi:hypothetical protein
MNGIKAAHLTFLYGEHFVSTGTGKPCSEVEKCPMGRLNPILAVTTALSHFWKYNPLIRK